MIRAQIMPVAMGLMMGVMAIMMMHVVLTGEGGLAWLWFVLGHAGVVVIAAAAVAFGLHRRVPMIQKITMHRPDKKHLAFVLVIAVTTATLIHVVHGGPAWT